LAAVPVSHSASGTDDQAAVIQRGDDFVTKSDHLIPDGDAVDFDLPGGDVAALAPRARVVMVAVTVSKSVLQRLRPFEAVRLVMAHGWSFPSGHAANPVVVFATVGGPGVHLCLQQA
jgi:hypothetical protein